MDLNLTSCHLYAGRGAGKPIARAIEKAKRTIEISSPYISKKFIFDLVEKQKQGVAVTLVTSNHFLEGKDGGAIGRSLIRQTRHVLDEAVISRKRTWIVGVSLLLLALIAIVAAFVVVGENQLKMQIVAVLSGVAGCLALYSAKNTTIYSYSYSPVIDVIVCNPWDKRYNKDNYLIHTKAYAIDDRLGFFGSCNYTYSGFSYNHEFRLDLTNPDDVKSVSKEVKSMRHSLAYMAIPTETLGKMFYAEPKN